MLSQNEIWEGIVHQYADEPMILTFLENYCESEHYEALSNHDKLGIDIFCQTIEDTLQLYSAITIVYEYIEYRLYDYGWKLKD